MKNILYRLKSWRNTRYGTDQLSRDLLFLWLASFLISRIDKLGFLYYIGYAAFFVSIFRSYSHSSTYYKRQRELSAYLNFWRNIGSFFSFQAKKLTDGNHKYLRCSNCKKSLRVPKNKGEIIVTCPVCGNKTRCKS